MSNYFEGITYDTSVYGDNKYRQYDVEFKDEQTVDLVDRIEDLLIGGYKQNTIAREMVIQFGFSRYNASMVVKYAFNHIVRNGIQRKEKMLEKNLARLEHLYGECMKNNDRKTAISTIDTMNKLCGLYKEKIEVTKNDFEFHLGSGKVEDNEEKDNNEDEK